MLNLAALGLLAGCSEASGPERPLSGKSLYQRNCARCHGADGKGTPKVPAAKDLTNLSYMKTRSDADLRAAIMQGKPPTMPAFGGQFAEPSMKVLVAYVRSLSQPSVSGATEP